MVASIAFASSRGSTRGIAERIASRLDDLRVAADVRAVTEDPDLRAYDAVVLGSAIHGGKWLPEGNQFATQNATALGRLPTWLFSVSTLGDEESMFPPRVARRLRAMRKETEEIRAAPSASST